MTCSHSLLVSSPTGRSSGSSLLCDDKYICHENPLSQSGHVLGHVESMKGGLQCLIIKNLIRNWVVCSGQKGGASLLHQMSRKGLDSALTVKHCGSDALRITFWLFTGILCDLTDHSLSKPSCSSPLQFRA